MSCCVRWRERGFRLQSAPGAHYFILKFEKEISVFRLAWCSAGNHLVLNAEQSYVNPEDGTPGVLSRKGDW